MRPPTWNPPLELSEVEEKILRKIRKAKLFIWLRKNRHLLFDEKFPQELAKIYQDSTVGLSKLAPCPIS